MVVEREEDVPEMALPSPQRIQFTRTNDDDGGVESQMDHRTTMGRNVVDHCPSCVHLRSSDVFHFWCPCNFLGGPICIRRHNLGSMLTFMCAKFLSISDFQLRNGGVLHEVADYGISMMFQRNADVPNQALLGN